MSERFQRNNKVRVLLFWLAFILSALLLPWHAPANNVVVSNAAIPVLLLDPVAQTVKVQFDIKWSNSWSHLINHDAAWVFIKFSTNSASTWEHATLNAAGTNPAGFSAGSGTRLDIVVSADKKGAFLRRNEIGAGAVCATNVQMVWHWGSDGVTADNMVRVKVFAVEMVYIPSGAYYAGSGGTEVNRFTKTQITTANASVAGGYPTGQTPPLASWPNGYGGFYVMKYEISQGQYRDFLNSLAAAQAGNRCSAASAGDFMCSAAGTTTPQNRNGIQKQAAGYACDLNGTVNGSDDGEWIACNWLSWADLAAYTDWAALRPMTEMEFEKTCRGMGSAVTNEYPWGSSALIYPATGIRYSGQWIEGGTNANGNANCVYGNQAAVQGPLRCASFAGSLTSRIQAGAAYYGVMELAGNVWERCVTIGHATGRTYTGEHGDGALDADGDADTVNWPGTDAVGAGARGGCWQTAEEFVGYCRVSDRIVAATTDPDRKSTGGGRCTRTAP